MVFSWSKIRHKFPFLYNIISPLIITASYALPRYLNPSYFKSIPIIIPLLLFCIIPLIMWLFSLYYISNYKVNYNLLYIYLLISLLIPFIYSLFITFKFNKKIGGNANKLIDNYYVISLNNENGQQKWDTMKQTVLGKYITKVEGINGKEINVEDFKDDITPTWDYGTWRNNSKKLIKMSQGEIGCALSHLKSWKQAKEDNVNIAMILEDDGSYLHDDFLEYLNNILTEVPEDWDVIMLGFLIKNYMLHSEEKIGNLYKIKEFVLTHCYIINKKTIDKLLDNLPINAPVDTWIASLGAKNKLNIYRHNYILTDTEGSIYSNMVQQRSNIFQSEIDHTNIVE
tara:strand:- start:178 stop:1200 length:1023 start_codon:yes stop_codon:yes gene_type:complete